MTEAERLYGNRSTALSDSRNQVQRRRGVDYKWRPVADFHLRARARAPVSNLCDKQDRTFTM